MPGGAPGPQGSGGTTESAKDGKTTALLATPPPTSVGITYDLDDSLSYELSDAPEVCVPTTLHKISLAEMRTIAWLRLHKGQIVAAEAQFSIDRRAIAAAIAWEALQNNKRLTNIGHNLGLGRSVGPGKVHISSGILFGGPKSTWAFDVEQKGLLPKQSDADRKALLATADGAIDYIAASMDRIAIIYEAAGSPGICSPAIRVNPYILTNEYQGSDPEKWSARVKSIKPKETLRPGNTMPLWLAVPRNMSIVEDAVGDPPAALSNVCKIRDITDQQGQQLLKAAQGYLNVPYAYGGGTRQGMDCSHLIYKSINDAFPKLKFEFAATDILASSPNLRKLENSEAKQAGDIILFAHHVGFYDPTPPPDKAGQTLFSARGDKDRSDPGVTWGKSEWFGTITAWLRVRVPCD
jgi:NlpC/P60 family protein